MSSAISNLLTNNHLKLDFHSLHAYTGDARLIHDNEHHRDHQLKSLDHWKASYNQQERTVVCERNHNSMIYVGNIYEYLTSVVSLNILSFIGVYSPGRDSRMIEAFHVICHAMFILTHWGRHEMSAIFRTIFSNYISARNVYHSDPYFMKLFPGQRPICQYSRIGDDNALAPDRRQAVIWTNYSVVY